MKAYRWKRLRSKGSCAKGSFRSKKLGGGKLLRICCPKGPGHWSRGTCRVGTVGYEVGTRKGR